MSSRARKAHTRSISERHQPKRSGITVQLGPEVTKLMGETLPLVSNLRDDVDRLLAQAEKKGVSPVAVSDQLKALLRDFLRETE